jgi:hypothetical protein
VAGPQARGKRISEFAPDGSGELGGPPVPLVEYAGVGKATTAGLAAASDGLYFTDLFPDLASSPIEPGANLLRVRYVGPPAPDGGEEGSAGLAKAARTLELDASRRAVEKGRKVRLAGSLDAPGNEAVCETTHRVVVQRKRKPDAAFRPVAYAWTNQAGRFADKVRINRTFVYRARVPETESCADGVSNTERVRARKPSGR